MRSRLGITILLIVSATGFLSREASAFSRLATCYAGPLLNYPIERQILNCTMIINAPRTPAEDKAAAYYGRGQLYMLEGDNGRAIADFTSALGSQEDYRDAYEGLGDVYQHMGRTDKAADDYAQSAKLGDDPPLNLVARCWMRAVRGYPLDRALSDCTDALQQMPDTWQILYTRSFVQLRMGNYPAAIADCEAASKLDNRLDGALYVCGIAKLRSGDTAGGNADLAAAKDANYRIADIFALYGIKP